MRPYRRLRSRLVPLHPAIKFSGLGFNERVLFGVGQVEFVTKRARVGSVDNVLTQFRSQVFAFFGDFGEERIAVVEATTQVRFGPHHRVGLGVGLFFFFGAVFGWVVGGRVGTHAVGVGFNQDRSPTTTGRTDRPTLPGSRGDGVIAVDGKAVNAITGCVFEQWHLRLHLERGRDRPVVVLNVEDHRGVKGGSKDHGLVDVAFGRSAITKARNSYPAFCSTARIGPTALLLGNPPAIAHGVGHLSGEYYGVRLHVVVVGVPAAVDGTAEEIEYVFIG